MWGIWNNYIRDGKDQQVALHTVSPRWIKSAERGLSSFMKNHDSVQLLCSFASRTTLVVITMNRKWEYAFNYNFPPPTMHWTDQIIQMEMYISRVHTGHQWSLTVQLGTSFSTIAVRYTWLIWCWIWGNFHWFDHWVDRIRASLSLLFNNVKSQP